MLEKDIPDLNIFMMCDHLNPEALRDIPKGFYVRSCKPKELDIWKSFPFDNDDDRKSYYDYMTEYFNSVYLEKKEEFYLRCLFLCEEKTDKPVSTCFIWKAYNKINTIHWFKTIKEYEGRGLGRALLSYIMSSLDKIEYPVFLHTQPGSFRAIELYSSFGFKIVTNDIVGYRENHYKESLPILKQFMAPKTFQGLQFTEAPTILDECARSTKISQF